MIPDDQIRFILGLTFSIPLSLILRYMPNYYVRHLFNFVFAIAIQIYIYGLDMLIIFGLHIIIYLIIYLRSQKCGAIVTILSLGILSLFHIYRMILDYGGWKLDTTSVLMGLVCKYSLLAYAVEDGNKKQKDFIAQQQNNDIKIIPSFPIFLSYCLFLPTLVFGTAIEFKYFENYMQKKGNYQNIPFPLKKTFNQLIYAITFFILYIFGLHYQIFSFLNTDQFLQKGIPFILLYAMASLTLLRSKYYFAWKYGMIPIHLSGISYQKLKDGKENFLAVQVCNPLNVQFGHMKQKLANWNMSCQYWLKRSIYDRCPFKQKATKQFVTFLVSAFWHGFYPGYYFSFFFWYWQLQISNLIYYESKQQNSQYVKFYKKTGIIGRSILLFLSSFIFTFNAIFFYVLSFQQSIKILTSIYFIPQIFVILAVIYFKIINKMRQNYKRKISNDLQEKNK